MVKNRAVISYTGSRKGMTSVQIRNIFWLMKTIVEAVNDDPDVDGVDAHHGDCEGGDAQFHVIATVLGCRTIAHPPSTSTSRAYCKADIILDPKTFLKRDWDIVAAAAKAGDDGRMVSAPGNYTPRPRGSGTWTTIRYSVQQGVPNTIFFPDGTFKTGTEVIQL